jgi:hypothetical protein
VLVPCGPSTRVIIAYYSSLWRPALTLAWRFGLTTKGPEHNWVTPADVANLLRLTGFELISESQHILLPVQIPVISTFVNRWLAPLPVLRWFALVNIALVRPAATPSPSCAATTAASSSPSRPRATTRDAAASSGLEDWCSVSPRERDHALDGSAVTMYNASAW